MRVRHWFYTVPLRLRSIFRREQVARELAEELQFHLEMKIEEGIAAGLAPEEARRRALRALGGLDQRREEMREAQRVSYVTDFIDDLRFALRSLRRTPGLAALVVVTLALGIGMTATPFSMLDALVFRPYPVPHPEQVMALVGTSRDDAFQSFSWREYVEIRDQVKSFDGLVAYTFPSPVGFAAEAGATPLIRGGALVSGNFFSVLGVEPAIGRGFRPDEDTSPGRDAVAVLAHDFWRRDFASDPGVVGRTVLLNGTEFRVIGVAPEAFPGMQIFSRPDLYVPLAMAERFSTDPRKRLLEDRDDRQLAVRGRLTPGVSVAAARAELAAVAERMAREYPETNRDRSATVRTMLELRTQSSDVNWKFGLIFTLLGVSVLLVACTNVAGLLLARARSRTREISVRLALGAGRLRLVRLLLTESLLLAFLGGAGGIAVGWAGIGLLQRFTIPAELPLTVPFRMDGRVLTACIVLSILSALVCGLAPAFQSTGANLAAGLKSADVDVPGRRRLWGRSALVVAQVAMSLMLLSASFLMARSFQRSLSSGLGFSTERMLLARFDPRLVQYDAGRTARFYEQLLEGARGIPGVRSAALSQTPPLDLNAFEALQFVPEGFDLPPERKSFTAPMDAVDPGYFETLGIPIVRGRGFLPSDDADSPRVAIVNQEFVKRWFPEREAVGERIRIGGAEGEALEIVGVAQTVMYRESNARREEFVYLPYAQHPKARMVLLLRTHGEATGWVDPLRELVRSLDSNLPIVETRTYDDLYRYHAVEGPGVAIKLVGAMGSVGLMLAVAGLYGLVAYNVSRRTREIGIRMAIGAAPTGVLRLFMGKGLVLVGVGTLFGLAMGVAVEKLMNAMIFETGGVDLVAYLVVVPAMLAVTMLAAYVPARRAARIAPTLALRCE